MTQIVLKEIEVANPFNKELFPKGEGVYLCKDTRGVYCMVQVQDSMPTGTLVTYLPASIVVKDYQAITHSTVQDILDLLYDIDQKLEQPGVTHSGVVGIQSEKGLLEALKLMAGAKR